MLIQFIMVSRISNVSFDSRPTPKYLEGNFQQKGNRSKFMISYFDLMSFLAAAPETENYKPGSISNS